MAWITKYRTEFTDLLAKDWKVDIEEDAWGGAITTMQATGDPLRIQHLAPSDDLYEGLIKGSIAELNIYSATNFQWAALYSTEDMQYRVSIYYDAVLNWRGYITSDNYFEPYDTAPYQVTITATDGLGMLKEYIYKYTTAVVDDTYYNGRRLASQIILDILGKIGITTFEEYVNIYAEGMNTGTGDSPFDQLSIDVDVFKDMYCYDVLTEILKPFNACIRMVNGIYVIYRPVELKLATIYGRTFTGPTTKTSTNYAPLQYISRSTHVTDVNDVNGGTLMIQKPAKKVTVTQDYGSKESWIENWEFEGSRFTGSYLAGFIAEGWTNVTDAEPLIIPISRGVPSEMDGVVLNQLNAALENYIYQEFGTYVIVGTETMCFQFDYRWFNESGAARAGQVFTFSVKDSAGTYYLAEVDAMNAQWTAGSANYTITEDVADGDSGWKTFKRIITDGMDVVGPYKVTFYCLDDAYTIRMGIRNVRLFATADEITVKYRKHKGPFPKVAKIVLIALGNDMHDIQTYIDKEESISREYIGRNAINGWEIEKHCIVGDVSDTTIYNVIEQFMGSMARIARDTPTQTAADFVTDHAADYVAGGVTVTSAGADIIFTSSVAGQDFTGNTTITNVTGNLSGTVVNTTANVVGVVEIDTITLVGTGGTADLTCGGVTEEAVWNTSLTQTAHDFVEDATHILNYGAVGITLSHSGADVIFTEQTASGGFAEASIANTSGDLNGTVADTQEPVAPVARVDTITLAGLSGTANILCDAVTKGADVDETMAYTTDWNTRSPGGESTQLIEITKEELKTYYSRPRHFISSYPIREGDTVDNNPHVNLLGNFKDDLNQTGGNDRVFVFNKGEYNIRDREWTMDLIEII